MTVDQKRGCLSIRRGAVLVNCNFGEAPSMFDVGSTHRLVLASDPNVCCAVGVVHLPAESVAVLEDPEAGLA